ncbi:MAG: Uma2 family endonuclease [Acidimicrobiales bacterium]
MSPCLGRRVPAPPRHGHRGAADRRNARHQATAPGSDHQGAVLELAVLLRDAARPAGCRVLLSPIAWRIGPGQVPEPDLVVASPAVVTKRAVEGPPVLVVEVLSPTGRARDLHEKRRIYARGGAAWYWIVDRS